MDDISNAEVNLEICECNVLAAAKEWADSYDETRSEHGIALLKRVLQLRLAEAALAKLREEK